MSKGVVDRTAAVPEILGPIFMDIVKKKYGVKEGAIRSFMPIVIEKDQDKKESKSRNILISKA